MPPVNYKRGQQQPHTGADGPQTDHSKVSAVYGDIRGVVGCGAQKGLAEMDCWQEQKETNKLIETSLKY